MFTIISRHFFIPSPILPSVSGAVAVGELGRDLGKSWLSYLSDLPGSNLQPQSAPSPLDPALTSFRLPFQQKQ